MEHNPRIEYIPPTRRPSWPKKVGIYARVSTSGKEQLKSLAAQISGLTQHVALRRDWLLVDIYVDVGSAKTGAERSEFNRLLKDCQNYRLDFVITKSVSRFGRDTVEVEAAVHMLLDSGVNIYFMEEDLKIDSNYDDRTLSIKAALNQSENERRSENIKLGLQYRAEDHSNGLFKRRCFGYKKNEDGNLVPDHEQATIVKMIYALYLSGASIISIINTLAQENIPSPKGSKVWSKKSVSTILTNLKYTGNVDILKTDTSRGSYILSDMHEAIISLEDFAQVQKEITRRSKKKRKYDRTAELYLKTIEYKLESPV